jgi:hypothetical protein
MEFVLFMTALLVGWLAYNLYRAISKPTQVAIPEVNPAPAEPVPAAIAEEVKPDVVVEDKVEAIPEVEVVEPKPKRTTKLKTATTAKTEATKPRTTKAKKTEEVTTEVAVKVKVPRKPNIKIAK